MTHGLNGVKLYMQVKSCISNRAVERRRMAYQYSKLKGRIIEKYGTQGKFAEAIGLSENSTSKKLKGLFGLSQEDMEAWAKLLDIDRDDFGEYFFT